MNQSNTLHILCAADRNFLPYCGVMLRSLFASNADEDICVHMIVPNNVNEYEMERFHKLAKDWGQCVDFIVVNPMDFLDCPIRKGDNVTLAAYYRILAPRMLPLSVSKVLYLDCDIIVNGSIASLYGMDLADVSCAVVVDPIAFGSQEYERLGYNRDLSYFNSGMMLINLDWWRRNDVMNKCFEFIRQYPERVIWHDQDALNYVLRDSKREIGVEWNFQSQFLYKKAIWGEISESLKAEIDSVFHKEPTIIHFSNSDKPWKTGSLHPYREYYRHHKALSPWSGVADLKIDQPKRSSLKERIFDLLVKLGLRAQPTRYCCAPLPVKL